MPGIFTVLGKIAEHILSPEQRRRTNLQKFRKEQDDLKKKEPTERNLARLKFIDDAIARLLTEAINK